MKKVSATIQQRLEQRLTRYVAMPTVATNTAGCKAAIRTIARELNALGLKVHIRDSDHPWVVATTRNTKHPRILLHAHFDVVMPASDDQLIMQAKDDHLYGRGVFDMKFALASYMEALKEITLHQPLSNYDLGVLVTTDEELGGEHGSREFLEQGWGCDIAVIPDGGRDFKIERRAKGFHLIYLDAHGTSTHGSRPWEGDNPIPKLIPAIQEVMEHFKNTVPQEATVSINGIDTPSSFTQVGDLARARIDVRAFEQRELDAVEAYLQQIANKYSLTMTNHLAGPPVILDEANPLVQTFVACQEKVRNQPVEFTESLGASDARYFAAKGIPTIAEYPHGGNAHSSGEWLSRKALVEFFDIIVLYIEHAALDRAGAPMGQRLIAAPRNMVRTLLKRPVR